MAWTLFSSILSKLINYVFHFKSMMQLPLQYLEAFLVQLVTFQIALN